MSFQACQPHRWQAGRQFLSESATWPGGSKVIGDHPRQSSIALRLACRSNRAAKNGWHLQLGGPRPAATAAQSPEAPKGPLPIIRRRHLSRRPCPRSLLPDSAHPSGSNLSFPQLGHPIVPSLSGSRLMGQMDQGQAGRNLAGDLRMASISVRLPTWW